MCKKIFFVAGGALLVSTLVFGRDVFSYMSTAASNARAAIKDNVPVEFEIDRARRQITNLNPEIEKNRRLIAQEKVRVERLKTQIARLETKLQGDRRHIARLKSDLDSGTEHYVYAGQTFSADEVRSELKLLFEQYKTQESTLEKLEGILAARQKSVTAAERKLDSMLAVKRQLELDVANLEARLKMVEVAKTTSELQF